MKKSIERKLRKVLGNPVTHYVCMIIGGCFMIACIGIINSENTYAALIKVAGCFVFGAALIWHAMYWLIEILNDPRTITLLEMEADSHV